MKVSHDRLSGDLPDPAEFPWYLSSFSALDLFYGLPRGRYVSLATREDLVAAAGAFEGLEFPGTGNADAAAVLEEEILLLSLDRPEGILGVPEPEALLPVLRFLYDPRGRRFYDPDGIYPLLRGERILDPEAPEFSGTSWEPWLDGAVLISRYGFRVREYPAWEEDPVRAPAVSPFRQREALVRILEGAGPDQGLIFLERCGFIRAHWPELSEMIRVRHGKEHHPEGDVWDHTLATFSHRKTRDLRVSLALLLHDAGKPRSREDEGNRFHNHAQLGERIAGQFLARLEFSPEEIRTVSFLVSRHMLPGLSRTLPVYRIREVLSSPLYPLLLEVYRCDLCSTFRGPDGYYEACKVYRRFLKNERNPFRDGEGKKLLRSYVE